MFNRLDKIEERIVEESVEEDSGGEGFFFALMSISGFKRVKNDDPAADLTFMDDENFRIYVVCHRPGEDDYHVLGRAASLLRHEPCMVYIKDAPLNTPSIFGMIGSDWDVLEMPSDEEDYTEEEIYPTSPSGEIWQ